MQKRSHQIGNQIEKTHKFFNKLFLGTETTPTIKRNLFQEEIVYLKKIWNNEVDKDFGIERLVKLFLSASRFLLPGLYIRIILNQYLGYFAYKVGIEVYVLLKLFLPLMLFFFHLTKEAWVPFVLIYLMIETFFYLLSKVFFGHLNQIDQVFYLRHITLLIINFIEISLCFAILYAHFYATIPNFFESKILHLRSLDFIYFSFITASSIGFGDIAPIHPYGKILSICQGFFFFLFVTLLINNKPISNGKPIS